jgi:hypothetical protein
MVALANVYTNGILAYKIGIQNTMFFARYSIGFDLGFDLGIELGFDYTYELGFDYTYELDLTKVLYNSMIFGV